MTNKEKKNIYVVDDRATKLQTIAEYMQNIYPNATVKTYLCPNKFLNDVYGKLDEITRRQEDYLIILGVGMHMMEGYTANCGVLIMKRLVRRGLHIDTILHAINEFVGTGSATFEDEAFLESCENYIGFVQDSGIMDQQHEFRALLGVKEDNEAKRRDRKKIFIADDDEGKLNAIKECMREIFPDAAIFTYTCLADIYHAIFHIRREEILAHKKDCLLVCDMQMPFGNEIDEIETDAGLQVVEGLQKRKTWIDAIICSSEDIDDEMQQELKKYPKYLGSVKYDSSCSQTDTFRKLFGM